MSSRLPARAAGVLLALVLALLVFRLGVVPIVGPDEPRYARVAVEMHRAGEWVTPTLQGRPWLEKPPLYYWLAGAAFSLLGETETAARLPSVFATVLLVGATAFFGARLYGTAPGLHAGFVAGTSILTLVLGSYLALTREGRRLRELLSTSAVAVFLAVAAPWYVAIVAAQGRRFLDVFILNHNIERFTSTIHHHAGPVWFYVPVLLAGLFPWSGLSVPALVRIEPRESRRDLFVLLWLVLPLVFFSLAGSKLPGYILPCVPPLALLMGRTADRMVTEGPTPERRLSGRVAALVGLVLGALVAAAPAYLFSRHEPLWRSAIPLAAWAVAVAFLFSRRVGTDPAGAFRLLRVGGAGLLLLVALVAPPILARRESGRNLFIPAMGREVLAWGAWRTAWMAGYFYNDGKVREVEQASEILAALESGPTLVLAGPSERRRLESMGSITVQTLAEGPRGDALLRLSKPAP
jgi:4-amino-4-deoxy-L-arabinose transferase-like glycosyltransferase